MKHPPPPIDHEPEPARDHDREFSPTSGTTLYACRTCGAAVPALYRDDHRRWHEAGR